MELRVTADTVGWTRCQGRLYGVSTTDRSGTAPAWESLVEPDAAADDLRRKRNP